MKICVGELRTKEQEEKLKPTARTINSIFLKILVDGRKWQI